MKHEKVLERVYEPGRLRTAGQQVRKNAGAAGIDKMMDLSTCVYSATEPS